MKFSRFVLASIIIPLILCAADKDRDIPGLYGGIKPSDYVTGRFVPEKNLLFSSLKKSGIPAKGDWHFLRKEAIASLKKLYDDFHAGHPGEPFLVRSSTRNFLSQKGIWESKWKEFSSRMKIKSNDEKAPASVASAILRYSSMPGTSRHHWGTDFDLNELNNQYFESGKGRVLYDWLKKNAARYGFCQPYTAGRKSGYEEEKWHWSYMPLSKKFLEEWNKLYESDPGAFSRRGLFTGSEISGRRSHEFANEINGDCR